MQRPDFSNYVAHFTKNAPPFGLKENADDDSIKAVTGDARERLVSILRSKKIFATTMPWTNKRAVAFTECPWGSLLDHTKQYSPYGVGFTKAHLIAAGDGPAIYLRPHLHEHQQDFRSEAKPAWRGFHPELYAFVTPFCPAYSPEGYKEKHWKGRPPIDYSNEREWRVPHEFSFELPEVQFIVVPDYEAVAEFPKDLKDAIGREKFIIVEVYSQIEKLWPVHLL